MGLNTIPAVSGLTRNVVAFTSSQTWTVPSTAQYVDVLVVGGGSGGKGGFRNTNNSHEAGFGGGVTILRNLFLNGTGTVAVTIGAGTSGTAGNATTTAATTPSDAGFSAFGTYVYSQGGRPNNGYTGIPGYKGTTNGASFGTDTNQDNYAPALTYLFNSIASVTNGAEYTGNFQLAYGNDAIGFRGGYPGASYQSITTLNTFGGHPGEGDPSSSSNNVRVNTRVSSDFYNTKSLVGSASAGTSGTGGGAGGAAGLSGFGGGGGTCTASAGQPGGQGGPGGGGGGSWSNPVGGTGGNGGNAGANTGAGGGSGANTGSTTAGTGGNGGNGAAGIVVVSWLG